MTITRQWAMPNKWTFRIKPIKDLLAKEVGVGMFVSGYWVDPFAGMNSPAQVKNDINKDMPVDSHVDALEFLKTQESDSFDGALFDPPYSLSQTKLVYENHGSDKFSKGYKSMRYWKQVKDEVARVIKSGGKAICFGWNTNGLGKTRGYQLEKVLIVPHGGSRNDTLITVETKL